MNRNPLIAVLGFVSVSACGGDVDEDRLDALERECLRVEDLQEYITRTEQEAALAGLASRKEIEAFVREEDLNAALAMFVTEKELALALEGLATNDALTDLEGRLAAVEESYVSVEDMMAMGYASEGDLEGIEGRLEGVEGLVEVIEGEIATIEGDYVRTGDVGDVVRLIDEDMTIDVVIGDDLREGLAMLDGYRIAHDVTVTFSLGKGAFNFTAPVELAHPDGARIEIVGAGVDATMLYFTNSDGLVVHENSAIGRIAELRLMGDGSDHDGLRVTESASVTVGNLMVEDFAGTGVLVEANGTLVSDGAQVAEGCGVGFEARDGGYLNVDGSTADGLGTSEIGFAARYGGLLRTDRSASSSNTYGYYASESGLLSAADSEATGNNYGFKVTNNATLYSPRSQASSSNNVDFHAQREGYLQAESSLAGSTGVVNYYCTANGDIWASESDARSSSSYNYYASGNGYIYAVGGFGFTDIGGAAHDADDFIIGLD